MPNLFDPIVFNIGQSVGTEKEGENDSSLNFKGFKKNKPETLSAIKVRAKPFNTRNKTDSLE